MKEHAADTSDPERAARASRLLPLINRKLVKQTVMTSVYGVTRYGATEQARPGTVVLPGICLLRVAPRVFLLPLGNPAVGLCRHRLGPRAPFGTRPIHERQSLKLTMT